MAGTRTVAAASALAAMAVTLLSPARAAEPVLVQCGREYQAAKSAGALNGLDWNHYRVACADRLKAASAAGTTPPSPVSAGTAGTPAIAPPAPSAVAPSVAPGPVVAPPAALPALSASAAAPSPGMAAMHARQKQCGAEWTAGKAALVAATPGLTWPKYWSRCNARLKAAPDPGASAAGR